MFDQSVVLLHFCEKVNKYPNPPQWCYWMHGIVQDYFKHHLRYFWSTSSYEKTTYKKLGSCTIQRGTIWAEHFSHWVYSFQNFTRKLIFGESLASWERSFTWITVDFNVLIRERVRNWLVENHHPNSVVYRHEITVEF